VRVWPWIVGGSVSIVIGLIIWWLISPGVLIGVTLITIGIVKWIRRRHGTEAPAGRE
jgi:hypothetical protein